VHCVIVHTILFEKVTGLKLCIIKLFGDAWYSLAAVVMNFSVLPSRPTDH